MESCHMPTMSKMDAVKDKEKSTICLGCNQNLPRCCCIWSAIRELQKGFSDNDERISDLENIGCEIRLIRVEECVNRITECDMKASDRKPYRCPVCYGDGQIELMAIELIAVNKGCKFKKCHGCDSKGVVWG